MNSSSSEALTTPSSPSGEQLPTAVGVAETGRKPAEQTPAVAETAPAPKAPGLAVPPMLPLPPPPTVSSGSPIAAPPLAAAAPLTDDDLIEKEWVNKAKAIVERTRDDPYRQSEELTVVKADFMQKHYNKTIKLAK